MSTNITPPPSLGRPILEQQLQEPNPWLPPSGLGFRLSVTACPPVLETPSSPEDGSPYSIPWAHLPYRDSVSSTGRRASSRRRSSAQTGSAVSSRKNSHTASLRKLSNSGSVRAHAPNSPFDREPFSFIQANFNRRRSSALSGQGAPFAAPPLDYSLERLRKTSSGGLRRISTDSFNERERERVLKSLGELNRRESLVVMKGQSGRESWADFTMESKNLPLSSWSPSTVNSVPSPHDASSTSEYSQSPTDSITSFSAPSADELKAGVQPEWEAVFQPEAEAGLRKSISLTFSFELENEDQTPKNVQIVDPDQERSDSLDALPKLLFSAHPATTLPAFLPLDIPSTSPISVGRSPPRLIEAFSDECDSDDDSFEDLHSTLTTEFQGQDFRTSAGWTDVYAFSAADGAVVEPSSVEKFGSDLAARLSRVHSQRGVLSSEILSTSPEELGYLSSAIRDRPTPCSSVSRRPSRPTLSNMISSSSLPTFPTCPSMQLHGGSKRTSLPIQAKFDRMAIFLNASSTLDGLAGMRTKRDSFQGDKSGRRDLPWAGQLSRLSSTDGKAPVPLGPVVDDKRLPTLPTSASSPALTSPSHLTEAIKKPSMNDHLPFETTFLPRAQQEAQEALLRCPPTPLLHTSLPPPPTQQADDPLCYCGTAYLQSKLNAPIRPHLRSTHLPSMKPQDPIKGKTARKVASNPLLRHRSSTTDPEQTERKRASRPWSRFFVKGTPGFI